MNRIDSTFSKRPAAHAGTLLPFVCGGHPAPGDTARVLPTLAGAGAGVIEVGIPFSDPIADGPVIAAAMHDALGRGATPSSVLGEIRTARPTTDAGVVVMVSISIISRCGERAFLADCASAGVDGVIVPDLPLEESTRVRNLAAEAGLVMPLLVAPTCPPERAERIARASTGFVYVMARAGITGESAALDSGALAPRLSQLRGFTDLPLACGFGISTPAQVQEVLAHADGAIVGSAMVRKMIDAAARGADPVAAAGAFARELLPGA